MMKMTLWIFVLVNLTLFGQEPGITYERYSSSEFLRKNVTTLVTINLKNEIFRKELRLIELLPVGVGALDVQAKGAKIEVVNERKITIDWSNVPANANCEISYRLYLLSDEQDNIRINGALYDSGTLLFQGKETVFNSKGQVELIRSK